ncbi:MAG: hypothetical protein IT292_00890 [Deltaproteobacteria bacterium]|nr:hypothetical protein [Deltaproteobacteria bacterium]
MSRTLDENQKALDLIPNSTIKESSAYMQALGIERNKAIFSSAIESANIIADRWLTTENIKPATKTEKDGN